MGSCGPGRGGRKGRKGSRRKSKRRGGRRGRSQQLNNGSPSLVRWRLISRVEKRESIRVRREFTEGFG
jgi:hypothetical protein